MRIALDSNILVYAEGMNDETRKAASRALISGLLEHDLVLPLQVLGETYNVLRRKFRYSAAEAGASLAVWRRYAMFEPDTSASAFSDGLELATDRNLQIWDGIILAASAEAGCRLLLSEDMQDGFVWRGVTTANPFAETLHPLLADALRA